MGLIAELASSVGISIRQCGQMELIAASDLVQILEAARKHNARVLGLEGFHIVGNSIVPDMDAIADFSSMIDSTTNVETVDQALHFLSNVKEADLFYEVTFREEPT